MRRNLTVILANLIGMAETCLRSLAMDDPRVKTDPVLRRALMEKSIAEAVAYRRRMTGERSSDFSVRTMREAWRRAILALHAEDPSWVLDETDTAGRWDGA